MSQLLYDATSVISYFHKTLGLIFIIRSI